MLDVKIVNDSPHPLPSYATDASAGVDLHAHLEEDIQLEMLERAMIPTGIYIELPKGYEAQIRPRSGLAAKHGISLVNSPGTIDADYRGEIKIILINLSKNPFTIKNGERIAQMVISKHEQVHWKQVDALSDTQRGSGGFGHTGK